MSLGQLANRLTNDFFFEKTMVRTAPRTLNDFTLQAYCQRLPHLVRYRMDPRLLGRVSSADIVEELATNLRRKAATHRCRQRDTLLRCLRSSATSQLAQIHRDYLARYRDFGDPYLIRLITALPRADVAELAGLLLGTNTAPASSLEAGMSSRSDLVALQNVFNSLTHADREILSMRHFERLSRREMAMVVQRPVAETCDRYLTALGRLKREYYRLNCLRVIPYLNCQYA